MTNQQHGQHWMAFAITQCVSTARKRTLPDIIRSYALLACSIGKVSIIARTPVAAANFSVSSESLEVPAGHPTIERRVRRSWKEETANGSALAPTITNLPRL